MVSISKIYNFTDLEKRVIKDLIRYSSTNNLESARILKNNRNITNKFTIDEFEAKHFVYPKGTQLTEDSEKLKILVQKREELLDNSTYIHTHPFSLPLSIPDLLQVFKNNLRKMVAVTLDGKCSVFENNQTANPEPIINELRETIIRLREELKTHGGDDWILKSPERFNNYKNMILQKSSEIAEKVGGKYYSDI